MNTLKCEICNLTFKNCHSISTHINKKHGLSPIFYYLKYIDNNDKCIICGEKTTFKSVEFGFRKYCSSKCGNKDVKTQDKIKQTKLEKYNDENYNNRDKSKMTNLEKYGVENPFQNKEIKEKIIITNLEKYGVEHPLQNNIIKIKSLNTNIDKYSGVTYTSTEDGKKTVKKTCFEKYGVENPFQNEEIKEKIKKTNFSNLGVNYPMQSKFILDKSKKTCLKKYGVEHLLYLKEFRDRGRLSHLTMEYKLNDDRIIVYQSKPELLYIKNCEKNKIYIENGDVIDYIFNNKIHKYFIDFKIKVNNKWRLVEIKGKNNWFFKDIQSGKLESKFNTAIKYSKDNKYLDYVLILDKNEYYTYTDLKNDVIK